jgi:cobalt-zinc-cadmium resistance protein CzcA
VTNVIERIIRSALDNGTLVLYCLLIALGGGVFAYRQLSTDVFPDLTVPVFNVITQNASMAPEELELSVTLLSKAPKRLAGYSSHSLGHTAGRLSGDGGIRKRHRLLARTAARHRTAFAGPAATARRHRPPLLSSLTNRLNEVYEFLVEGDIDPMQLRDLAEFDLRYRILAVPGVASVERLGGALRQYQVQLDPNRMRALGISLDEVMDAVRASNENAPGGVVSTGETEFSVRSLGRIASVEDLKRSVITARHGTPVTVAEVAAVVEGGAIRRGLARAGEREVVSSRVIKQVGADTVQVTRAIRAALEEAQKTLPAGVQYGLL